MATKKRVKKVNKDKLNQKRAKIRRDRTETIINDTVARMGPNPFHMMPSDKNADRATKSLIRAIRRFQQDYYNISEKYKSAIPAEPMTRHAVVSVLSDEIRK
jgi:hypothetical protein